MLQQILGSKILGRGRFLSLREIAFRDDRGRERLWESVDRSGNGSAAFVLARIVPDDQFLFVRQFRPPVGRLMLEFPAGLIDPGETPEQTAVRELYEETGFSGRVLAVSRPGFSSPGLTGEAITMVTMEIDGDACRGRKIDPHPEDSESIAAASPASSQNRRPPASGSIPRSTLFSPDWRSPRRPPEVGNENISRIGRRILEIRRLRRYIIAVIHTATG